MIDAVPASAGALSLIIGVTGHRDIPLEHVPALEATLVTFFKELGERYPSSSLVLLSPLAEGADQIAARAALVSGVRLIVPLPLPLELYETDFESGEARSRFTTLLGQAEASIVLPLLDEATTESVSRWGPARNREYAKVGAYVATYSHVFLALWDGVETPEEKNIGGTAQIVRFRLSGAPPPYLPRHGTLLRAGGAAVIHVLTPRVSKPSIPATFTRAVRLPFDRNENSIDRLLTRMDMFNQDLAALSPELQPAILRSQTGLLHLEERSLAGIVSSLPPASRPVLDQYAAADSLSIHFGRKTLIAVKQVFAGVFVAASLLNLHTFYYYTFFNRPVPVNLAETLLAIPWFLWCFLVLSTLTAFRFHRRAEKGEYQNKHQDYRALAEALRVQYFWLIAGITEPVAHRYLRKHRSDLEWIRTALLSSCVLMHARRGTDSAVMPKLDRLALLHECWIVDQRNYYASKAVREQRTLERETALGRRLLQASVVLALFLSLSLSAWLVHPIHIWESVRHAVEFRGVSNTIEFLMVILAVGAGLVLAYGDQMARAEHVRQFTRMGELFNAAEAEFAERLRSDEVDVFEDLVLELGMEALDESGDWLILHRDRPLEVPHAG